MVSMVKDARKCSHCGHNGHNSRRCNNSKGVGRIKLFGVWIDDNNNSNNNNNSDTKLKMLKIGDYESIRRSKSLGNLEYAANYDNNGGVEAGYLSDGPIHSPRHRKKGTSWNEEEHRCFLIGLEKLGKGDWRGISKYYVPSRTSTQVASHAQKYFIRISSIDKKKRRPSVFDVHLKDSVQKQNSQIISNKAPEVSKETNSPLEQLFDTCQIKGQASKGVPNATRERPPLSPSPISRPFGVPNLHNMPYVVGVPRNIQGVTTTKVGSPTISWIPIVNFQNQSHVHLRNYSQGPAFVPFVARPTPQVQSQAGHSNTTMTKKDGGNISIGAL